MGYVEAVAEKREGLHDDYAPKFDRLSTERRVLGFVTTEVDIDALGPRNTFHALQVGLTADDNTAYTGHDEQLQSYLGSLIEAGLLSEADGVYTVTDAGWTELVN